MLVTIPGSRNSDFHRFDNFLFLASLSAPGAARCAGGAQREARSWQGSPAALCHITMWRPLMEKACKGQRDAAKGRPEHSR